MNRFYLFFILNIITSCTLLAQFSLNNGSFEDKPQYATIPTNWYRVKMGSTPYILPGFWDVDIPPSEGNAYIGCLLYTSPSPRDS